MRIAGLLTAAVLFVASATASAQSFYSVSTLGSEAGLFEPAEQPTFLQPAAVPNVAAPSVGGYEGIPDGTCDSCGACGCCGCVLGGWYVGAESVFARYHRADGVRIGTSGTGEIVEFDYEVSPRITVGYGGFAACGGWCRPGIRARWWDYDHFTAGNPSGQGMDVETVVWDFEVYYPFQLSNAWSVEASAGIRYTEFRETMRNGGTGNEIRINDFDGYGGVFGIESKLALCYGSLYGRARFAVMTGDKYHRNDNTPVELVLTDTVTGMTEIGLGYELGWDIWCTRVVGRIGVEWQHWHNFSTEFVNIAPGGEDSGGPADVGFFGIVTGLGIYF